MLNVRLAGGHLCGKLLFNWLALVMSMMVSFCAVLFSTRCLSEGFRTYSCISELLCSCCVEILKSLPVHSFNALIIPVLRDCFTQLYLSISFLRHLPDTVLEVTSSPLFVSRCITVACLLFLWTCIRHGEVLRALVIFAFFLKVLVTAL